MCLTLRCFTDGALGSPLASFRSNWENASTRTCRAHIDQEFRPLRGEVWITLPDKPYRQAVVVPKIKQNLEWVVKKVHDEYPLKP